MSIYFLAAHPEGHIAAVKIDAPDGAQPLSIESAKKAKIPCPFGCEHYMTLVTESIYNRWKQADDSEHPSITCPRCFMTSYHPMDIKSGWCNNCRSYTSRAQEN